MTKKEFASLITKKIDDAYRIKEKAIKTIEFYTALNGEDSKEVIEAKKKIEYSEKLIKSLKDIVMLPIYERVQSMSNKELEEYRIKKIKTNKVVISELETGIYEKRIKIDYWNRYIVSKKSDYTSKILVKEEKSKIIEEVKAAQEKIYSINKEISSSEKLIKKVTEENIVYETMSYEELKQKVVKQLGVEDMKEVSEQKNISEVDSIMMKLKDNPQLASELQETIKSYLENEKEVLTNSIKCGVDEDELPPLKTILDATST